MADVSKTVEIIFKGNNQIGSSVATLQQSLVGIEGTAKEADAAFESLGNEAEKLGGASGPAAGINKLSFALKALAASAVLKSFVDANASIESFKRGLEVVTGSATAAEAEFEFLRKSTDRLGIDLLSVTDSYLSLAAATSGTSLEGAETQRIFEAIAGAMAVLGKSSQETSGVLTALQQIVSKNTVSSEELRQQLGDRLPKAFQLAADSMGVTTEVLNKLLSTGQIAAEDFLPKFATAIEDAFDSSGTIDTFAASLGRLKNSVTDAFLVLGDAGGFDVITKGLEGATLAIVSAIGGFELFGTRIGLVVAALADGDFTLSGENFKKSWESALTDVSENIRTARDRFFELGQGIQSVVEIDGTNGILFNLADEVEAAAKSIQEIAGASEEANKALKEIGIDPKQLEDPIEKILVAFQKLTQIDGAGGDAVFKGLLVTLDKLSSTDYLPSIAANLAEAFDAGRISADDLAAGYSALEAKGNSLSGAADAWGDSFDEQANSLQKSTEASKKAAEQAIKTATELEKIASNERIKNIEAAVNLNVAGIEADSAQAVAIIENLGTSIQATAELLGGLFENRLDADSWEERRIIEEGIRTESERRGVELEKNNQLIDAKISKLRAQADALRNGNSLITVDGAGLQPHLEAIMFEIFEALQVRVNAEGYELLLGAG